MVGGGNTAVEEALYLSNIAKHVTVVHRRDKFRAEAILIDRLMAKTAGGGNMRVLWDHTLDEVLGDKSGVTGVRAASRRKDAARSRTLPCTACSSPSATRRTRRSSRASSTMADGYIKVKGGSEGDATATSIPGVFAAGDVADHVYRQAVTSAGTGCMAALDAEAYLEASDGARHGRSCPT